MAKTLANLNTKTRTYLDEASAADWTDAEVKTADNSAYQDLCGKVMEVYENYYETTTPFTYAVVASQQEYTIDSSLIKVTRVEINYNPSDANSNAVRATSIKSDELPLNLAYSGTLGSTFNAGYYIHGDIGNQKIGFVPIPTNADTTGESISVWGNALPADLVSDSDNVNIPWADRFYYLICLRAAGELLRKGQQEEATAARYLAEYQAGVKEMQTFLRERQSDGVNMIQDALNDDIDFQTYGGI
jgi:hypothetical protein